jgi:cadmium resistance protein CadD (predicted permease)
VNGIAGTVATAAVMFATTNLDDAVVLAALNAAARSTGSPTQWQIWVGQYLGIGSMVVVSLLAALGLSVVPLTWVGLLGLIPFTRGIVGLIRAIRAQRVGDPELPAVATGLWSVFAMTFANGGDNIATYTAAFRISPPADTALTIAVFAVGVAVWCLASLLVVAHTHVVNTLQRYGRWIIPAVFILLGLYIFQRSGLLNAVTHGFTPH